MPNLEKSKFFKNKNRNKICCLMPPGRVKRISRHVLGIKESHTKKSRLFSYGWRFCLGASLVLFLLTGLSPLDLLKKTIGALNEKTDTVNLYAGSIKSDTVSDHYQIGWWNLEKAFGEPDIAPDGALSDFSDDNSAFYAGGKHSLILSDFNLAGSEIYDFSESNNEFDNGYDFIDEDASAGNINAESEAGNETTGKSASEETIIVNEDEDQAESDSGQAGAADIDAAGDGGISADIEIRADEDIEINESSSSEEDEVEIIEEEAKEPLILIEEDDENNNNDVSGEVSFYRKVKNYFEGFRANAQEDISSKVENLDDLGIFERATIKLSLAIVGKDLQESLKRAGEIEAEELLSEELNSLIETAQTNEPNESVEETDLSEEVIIEDGNTADPAKEAGIIEESEEAETIIIIETEKTMDENAVDVEGEAEEEKSELEKTSLLNKFDLLFKPLSASAELNEPGKEAKIIIWYALAGADAADEDILWQKLDTISTDILYNNLQNGYLSYQAPFLGSWRDARDLKIKLEGQIDGQAYFMAYLDSLWIEAEYRPVSDLEKIETRQRWQEALEMLSKEITFKAGESGEMVFKYNKNKNKLWDSISEMIGLSSFWQDIDISARIIDPKGSILDLDLAMIFSEDGEFKVRLPALPRDFRPGLYKIRFSIEDLSGDEAEKIEIEKDFSWGVLAINTNKSVYLPLEEAYLQMAALNDKGRTICDAELELEITAPQGTRTYLKTSDGSITKNKLCGPNNVITTPDYYAFYDLAGAGLYRLSLRASTSNGIKTVKDQFEVRESLPFEIERIGPTRIYPLADYEMRFKVKANKNYKGDFIEKVPDSFEIRNPKSEIRNKFKIQNSNYQNEKTIIWENLNLSQGDEIELSYSFDAPDVSPEFYLLGEAVIGDFSEARQWQIAADFFITGTSSSGVHNGWTLPTGDEPWDAGNNTYGSRLIPKKGVDDSAYYLRSTQNNIEDLGGTINSVEIGVEGHVQEVTANARLVPMFGGSVDGAGNYVASGTDLGTVAGIDTPVYKDITYDINRPLYPEPWTWSEIQNLDIRVFGNNTSNSQDRSLYIDQIWIRVDYTPNTAPVGTIESAAQRLDDSGAADIAISVSDADGNYSRARLEYGQGAECASFSGNATLDETDDSATSTIEDVTIDNNLSYQIGSSTANRIKTDSGINYVYFDWFSKSDLNNIEGEYCLQLTANDYEDDQLNPATTTIIIDNKAPTIPGSLSEWGTTTKESISLSFGATSTDINFYEYKIFYSTSTPVTETDYLFGSSSDLNLEDAYFKDAATTTINGLEEDTLYYFSIWAYDTYGHKSSSSPISISTNKAPFGFFTAGAPPEQKNDGTGIVNFSIDARDLNNDISRAKIEYATGTGCVFSPSGDPTLDEASLWTLTGAPVLDNSEEYQISDIITSATNTLTFDWPSGSDLPTADSEYCFRLSVNDGADDQNISALATTTLDNTAPTAPGQLQEGLISTSSIKLLFGATTTETNFLYYKIFYKQDTAGVTEFDTPHIDSNLNDKYYNGVSTTTVSGLSPNTDYVFNIWAYDQYGHKTSSSEIAFKTSALIYNNSLSFTNPYSGNYAIANGISEWNFRASVSDESGWTDFNTVVLRLADDNDNNSPFDDIEFTWNQATNNFSETGVDIFNAVTLSGNSSSTCASNLCTLDFKAVFNSDFASSSVDYSAELISTNDSAVSAENSYPNFYQIKKIRIEQLHFRWRNNDGGE